MDAPATTNTTPPAPNADPAKKPGRKPLDEAGRAAAAQKAVARKLAKKLGNAKSTDELWALADELRGRKATKSEPDEEEKKEIDPADVPIAPSWPTPRAIAKVQPMVAAAVGGLASLLAATRYNALSEPLFLPGPAGEKGEKTFIEIDRKDAVIEPAAACLALLTGGNTPDIHPGWALLLGVTFAFGPAAAAHGWELWTHRNDAPDQPKPQVVTEEKSSNVLKPKKGGA